MNVIELGVRLNSKLTKEQKKEINRLIANSKKDNPEVATAVKKIVPKFYDRVRNSADKIEQNFVRSSWRKAAMRAVATGSHSRCPVCNSFIPDRLSFCSKEHAAVYGVSWSKESREKRLKTNLERYGGNSPSCSLEVRDRQMKALETKHGIGILNPSQIPGVIETKRRNSLAKRGVEHHMQDPEFTGYTDAMFKKYGVRSPMQVKEFQSKARRTAHSVKVYIDRLGNKHEYQGYEDRLLKELDVEGFRFTTDTEAITHKGNDGRIHTYTPDVKAITPSGKRVMFEVKSTRTLFHDVRAGKLDRVLRAANKVCRADNAIFQLVVFVKEGPIRITWPTLGKLEKANLI